MPSAPPATVLRTLFPVHHSCRAAKPPRDDRSSRIQGLDSHSSVRLRSGVVGLNHSLGSVSPPADLCSQIGIGAEEIAWRSPSHAISGRMRYGIDR